MNRLVIVKWEDTYASTGWESEPLDIVAIKSVGWLIYKDKKRIVLSSMVGSSGLLDHNCQQAIPRGCIQSIRQLEE